MAREQIIDRIKKLLALAKNNPSAAEATAAALKAQKLIADNDVSKDELYDEKPEDIAKIESQDIIGKPWAVYLARAIADNFRCQHYFTESGYRGWSGRTRKTGRKAVFVGYETDAEAAQVTFDRLFEIGERLADAECRRAKRTYGTTAGVRNSFLVGDGHSTGYVSGIRSELEKQSKELMLVRPKAVSDFYEEMSKGFGNMHTGIRSNGYNSDSAGRGYKAGRDSLKSARMGGQLALDA